jgi:hypothetical protein
MNKEEKILTKEIAEEFLAGSWADTLEKFYQLERRRSACATKRGLCGRSRPRDSAC